MSTLLSTFKKYFSLYSRIVAVCGVIILASGATILFSPQRALADTVNSVTGEVLSGTTVCIPNANIPWNTQQIVFTVHHEYNDPSFSITPDEMEEGVYGGIKGGCDDSYTLDISTFVSYYGITDGTPFFITLRDQADGSQWVYAEFIYHSSSSPDVIGGVAPDTTTHIETVTPADKTVTATSTSFTLGFTGFLSDTNLNSGSQVTLSLQNSPESFTQCADVICSDFSKNSVVKSYTLPLTSSGSFSFSTTTSLLQIGRYYMTVSVQNNRYSILGYSFWSQTLVSTSTTFVLSTTTNIDAMKEAVSTEVDQLTGVANNPDFLSQCTFSNLNVYGCLTDIAIFFFVPDNGSVQSTFDSLKAGMFSHVPFGYITRTIDIFNTESTSTLPSLSYTFPSDFVVPDFRNTTLNLTPWKYFYNGSSTVISDIKSNGSNPEDVWEIFEPLVNTVVYLTLLFMIIKDLTHVHPNNHKKL